ncbi:MULTISPECIES: ABC transporter substrate-binding protein [unclassified Pseudomonas]|uniref:ABC transporter substrate-binding protein n=1 Tax=unclassified Pseudomonas TaxID=196821 RepID=UPI00131D5A60|nr:MULTISPECIES: ABC transporter substrate-binding protein [unclassified Pseudomonas]
MFSRIPAFGIAATFLLASSAANACTPGIAEQNLIEPGKLQLSINPTNPPQQFVDKDGKLQGLNVELTEAMSKRLCTNIELVRMDFPAMIPAMNAGRIDGMNTGMFWTADRSKLMYLVPYSVQSVSVVANPKDAKPLGSLDDLAGKSVSVEANSYQYSFLQKQNEALVAKGLQKMELRSFPTATNVISAMFAGQVDYSALVDSVARDLVKRERVTEVLPGQGLSRTAMAFRNKAVAEAVAKTLTEMRADGSYQALFEKFSLTPLPAQDTIRIDGPGPT